MKGLPEIRENRLDGGKRAMQHFRIETDYVVELSDTLFPSNYVLILVFKHWTSNTSFFMHDEKMDSQLQVNVAILNSQTLMVEKWLQPTDLIHADFVCKRFNFVGVENITQGMLFSTE